MCRFTVYLGPPIRLATLLTEPSHSLIRQSVASKERAEPLNGDGFGVAYYVRELSPEPAVFRAITPAWSNRNLNHLARVTRSDCILAHVRAATPGLAVTETNCHPFAHGRMAMVHNGYIGGFRALRRALLAELSDEPFGAIHGTTDSEHLFALYLEQFARLGEDTVEAMGEALRRTLLRVVELASARGIDEPSLLNVAIADGERLVVSRYSSDPGDRIDSLYLHGDANGAGGPEAAPTVIVSSEPLSATDAWQAIPRNHIVLVDADRRPRLRAVAA